MEELGKLYGQTNLISRIHPSKMIGQAVEVYWPEERDWYSAVIFAEQDDGTYHVKYEDECQSPPPPSPLPRRD